MEGAAAVAADPAPSPAAADASARATRDGLRDGFLPAGNPAPVLRAAVAAARAGEAATLAWVLETEGSTYAGAGAMVLFGPGDAHAGWLSGGCLEPELARRAAEADARAQIEWIEIDTRDDAELLSGSALGCRGRLRIALLPLRLLPGIDAPLQAWLDGGHALLRRLDADGRVELHAGPASGRWRAAAAPLPWAAARCVWTGPLARPPEALLLGAGPETARLLGLLRDLGWRATLVERRPRWREAGAAADARHDAHADALRSRAGHDAALVMHHDFERDRDALEGLAATDIPFIGLLGPPRRRDDLLRLLPRTLRDALRPRLRAPVGLDLGGQGPEAIALSIAAQLQAWRARADA